MSIEDAKIVKCPHCGDLVIVQELNCKIFRHGIYRKTGEQMDPHSRKEICDRFFAEEKIWGCGKPFRVLFKETEGVFVAEMCDYL